MMNIQSYYVIVIGELKNTRARIFDFGKPNMGRRENDPILEEIERGGEMGRRSERCALVGK